MTARVFFPIFILLLPVICQAGASAQTVSTEEPMAPFVGPGKKAVMKQLHRHKKGSLVITVGRDSPQFVIRFVDNRYELSPLESNPKIEEQITRKGQSEGYLVPEMLWGSLFPGTPIIRESDLRTFLSKLDSWPGWPDVEPYVFDKEGNLLGPDGNALKVDAKGRIVGPNPYQSKK
jgi:hypothetical protein